jgi:hypothetical protein
MFDQGLQLSHRMQGLDLEVQHNPSNEGIIGEEMTSEVGSVTPGRDQLEEPTTNFVEGVVPYTNPPLTNTLGPLLIEISSMIFLDAYSSYHLPTSSTTRKYFGMNTLKFEFTEGLGVSPPLSTSHVVARVNIAIVGAYSLLGTYVTQVTLTQPLLNTSLFAHGSGNILSSLVSHMHTPSVLLGHPIGHMDNSQFIHTTTITQDTQPTCPTLQMGSSYIPFIGGQSSWGGQPLAGGKTSIGCQPLAGGKPSIVGKPFYRGKPSTMGKTPMWGKQQQAWGKDAPASPSIPTTTVFFFWTTIYRSLKSFMGSA